MKLRRVANVWSTPTLFEYRSFDIFPGNNTNRFPNFNPEPNDTFTPKPKPNLKPDGVHNPNPLAVANIPWSQCRPERLSDQPEIECVIQRTGKMYIRYLQLHVLVVFYVVLTIIALVNVLPRSS